MFGNIDPWKIQQIIDEIWYLLHSKKPTVNIDNISDYWLISDTHFNHKKVQEYCNRPDGWQELIISNWNKVIKKNDVVLHLGDFAFGNKAGLYSITKQLNGIIFMIKGNHDRHSISWYNDLGITRIPSFSIKGDIHFTHRAIKDNNFEGINIHGHTHQKGIFIKIDDIVGSVYVNMSVEQIDYTPMKLSAVLQKIAWNIICRDVRQEEEKI
jgi:calcineurin-like phosphoesterase family protein